MSGTGARGFFFATAAQWRSCRFAEADAGALAAHQEVRPFAPYARPGVLNESDGGCVPVVSTTGDVLWRDRHGCLHRLEACQDDAESLRTPSPIARSTRAVATAHALWVLDPPASLHRYEDDSLTRAIAIDVPDVMIADLASAGRDSVRILFQRDHVWQSAVVDGSGRVGEPIPLKGVTGKAEFACLRRRERIVVLDRDRQRLLWFSAQGGRPLFSLPLAAVRPCFEATAIGSDGRDRVFVGGADGATFGGGRCVLILDADGNALGDVPIEPAYGKVNGIAAGRDALYVAVERGLLRFTAATVVPDNASTEVTLVTPMLQAPEQPNSRRWLRAEATASLPEGSTLEFLFASTDRDDVRDRVNAILGNPDVPEGQRVRLLLREPDLWHGRTEFSGAAAQPGDASPFSARLFDLRDRYLWAAVTLHAAPGSQLPRLTRLAVLYPGRTLMESLPAIYRADEERSDSFLRTFVGVLETTSQGLDRRIASMGSRIHPDSAPGDWLDFIARWPGLPWDDAMTLDQKRNIVKAAPAIAKGRGTRAGLEALLDALIPGMPKRFRVTDPTADVGFAVVGGGACEGSALPAMLGGHTGWQGELNATAVLGHMRLPCPGQLDDGVWQLAGRVRVEIAATAIEQQAWRPWLRGVIGQMVPLTARLDLRWVAPAAFRSDRLGESLVLESTPDAHLGDDALTGLARLPQRGARLSSSGPSLSTRLR